MNFSWLFNLFFWHSYKVIPVRVTLQDSRHRKTKVLYLRFTRGRHCKG